MVKPVSPGFAGGRSNGCIGCTIGCIDTRIKNRLQLRYKKLDFRISIRLIVQGMAIQGASGSAYLALILYRQQLT